jgi:hypothetical protein
METIKQTTTTRIVIHSASPCSVGVRTTWPIRSSRNTLIGYQVLLPRYALVVGLSVVYLSLAENNVHPSQCGGEAGPEEIQEHAFIRDHQYSMLSCFRKV